MLLLCRRVPNEFIGKKYDGCYDKVKLLSIPKPPEPELDAEAEEKPEEKPVEANPASTDEAQANTVTPDEQIEPEAKADEA